MIRLCSSLAFAALFCAGFFCATAAIAASSPNPGERALTDESIIRISARPAYVSVQCVEFAILPRKGETSKEMWSKAVNDLKIASLPSGAGQREAGPWVGTVERQSAKDALARLSASGPARVSLSESQTQRSGAVMRFSGAGLAEGQSLDVSGALRGVHDLALGWRFLPGSANSRIAATRGFATMTSGRSFVIAYARDGALRLMVVSATPSAFSSTIAVW